MNLRLLQILLVLVLFAMPVITLAQDGDSNALPPGLGSANDPNFVPPLEPEDEAPTGEDDTVPPGGGTTSPTPPPLDDPIVPLPPPLDPPLDESLGPVVLPADDFVGPPAPKSRTGITNPLKNITSIPGFIEALFDRIVLPIGISIAVLFIIYSGFLFVVAQGNEQKLAQAKSTFMWTIIGTAILLGSWAIAVLIKNTVDQLRADIPKHIVYEETN